MFRKVSAYFFAVGLAMAGLTACSTKKNTSGSRFYHSVTARYNTFFNGSEAYKAGLEAQENGHTDDYTSLLPMFLPANKQTQTLGKSNYETTITKCEKAIKTHSIKSRPKVNVNKKKTDKDKVFLTRKEFNPFLKHAWLLMGKAQFQQGDFIEAASTFNYAIRLYAGQPEVVSVARAYLARCYVELEWAYDAEDVFNKIRRDSLSRQGAAERDASYADYLILTRQYTEAIPYLQKTIKKEKRKKLRARLNFLLGQLYRTTGNNTQAYKALKRVVRSNPPYELALNARVMQSEVMSKGQYRQMIKRLQRMARNDKNKEYLDQLYYAIGNIYLSAADTIHCIGAYETGITKSTRNGIAKAVLLLRLGEIYWEREDYINAQRCYAEATGLLDKEHEDYKEADRRSQILTELEPHLSAVKLQDSLQALARMPEAQRNAAIDRVIDALKKKEKEEARLAAAQGTQTGANATGTGTPATGTGNTGNRGNTAAQGGAGNKGAWYFYNPMVVTQGKSEFQRRWGKRPNEDNWRRSDKTALQNNDESGYNYDEPTDSVSPNAGEEPDEEAQALKDSLANDPHHREYYLKQIPFTDEQLAASHQVLSDGLYQAGILEMERLENFNLAYRTLLRLLTEYPEYGTMDNIYYHLFLLNGREGRPDEADDYRQRLIDQFPDSKYATLLSNPNYERNARFGKHLEDSLYAATYAAYQAGQYAEVERNYRQAAIDFPEGIHRPKFLFIRAMSQLYDGQRDSFLVSLKEVVSRYPKNEITEMANYIVKGVQEGRLLNDGKFDVSNIWGRREQSETADTTQQSTRLSDERYCNFVFLLAYPDNSLDEDQLLYEMARYNFTSFMVRNFDIEIVRDRGLSELLVKGFLNFDEVHAYTQKLFADPHMAALLKGIRVVLISEQNLGLLGTSFSFDDYKTFYDEHFAPLQVPEDLRLDEPPFVEEQDEDAPRPQEENGREKSDDELFEELFN